MNTNVETTPSLSFKQAQCKAWTNLTNLNGRSRRSEFWWFFLVFYIAEEIISGIASCLLPLQTAGLIQSFLSCFAFAVTVRRLQDGAHSMWWVIISWISSITLNMYLLNSCDWETFQATENPEAIMALAPAR